ncbi:conserved hypothetical protein [Ricinus communis]|uniref:Uncharacterized protein n=1 Tax=Ricinus communis TaxID=3988 RepID=B9RJE1_RICCO|nr:conserved hypothetical protein [Ricinus communis]
MATAGYALAEAHVQRTLHKEKMKKSKEERAKVEGFNLEVKQSTGCFPSMFKKVHPAARLASVEDLQGQHPGNEMEIRLG